MIIATLKLLLSDEKLVPVIVGALQEKRIKVADLHLEYENNTGSRPTTATTDRKKHTMYTDGKRVIGKDLLMSYMKEKKTAPYHELEDLFLTNGFAANSASARASELVRLKKLKRFGDKPNYHYEVTEKGMV